METLRSVVSINRHKPIFDQSTFTAVFDRRPSSPGAPTIE